MSMILERQTAGLLSTASTHSPMYKNKLLQLLYNHQQDSFHSKM